MTNPDNRALLGARRRQLFLHPRLGRTAKGTGHAYSQGSTHSPLPPFPLPPSPPSLGGGGTKSSTLGGGGGGGEELFDAADARRCSRRRRSSCRSWQQPRSQRRQAKSCRRQCRRHLARWPLIGSSRTSASDVGTLARLVECYFASASLAVFVVGILLVALLVVAHIDVTVAHEQHAVLPIDGSPPEIGAAHGKRRERSRDVDLLILHRANFACRHPKRSRARAQHEFAGALLRIEDKAIDHHASRFHQARVWCYRGS